MQLNIKKYSKNINLGDSIIMFIFAFGPVFGSMITIASCIAGILYSLSLYLKKLPKPNFELKLLALVYLLYIFYFLLNGFFNSGIVTTLVAMAPNLPILCFAVISLGFNWRNSKINSKVVGLLSTSGVLLSIFLAYSLYLLSFDFEFNGRTLSEYTRLDGRLALFSGNPLPYSSILVACSFFGLVGYSKKMWYSKVISWVAIILAGLVIVFWSESRGSQVSFATLLSISILFLGFKPAVSFLRRNNLSLVFFTAFFLFLMISLVYNQWNYLIRGNEAIDRIFLGYEQIFQGGIQVDSAVKIRVEIYKAAVSAFFERPIFGYGYDSIVTPEIRSQETLHSIGFTHLHNSFLNHLIAGGSIGLIVFIIFLILPLVFIISFGNENSENVFFALLIFSHSLVSGTTNLYLGHDLLASFNGVLPLVLILTMIGDRKQNSGTESSYMRMSSINQ